jgi:hypothetical protein
MVMPRHNDRGSDVLCLVCVKFYNKCQWQLDEPSAQGYNWATLFLWYINTGTWSSKLGKSQMRIIYSLGPSLL